MATYTTRNDLIKPEYTDAADIEDLNDNMDFIDGSIAPCTWDATAAPTVDDDETLGYIVGSIWFDTTNHKIYMCESATDGAAVWRVLYNNGIPLVASGTQALTANWDVGAYKITANQLESDVASGTAPLVVASTTLVSNLNADKLDGLESTALAILAGQSGGQTLYGGTAAGNNLTLATTSNATKGAVILPDGNLEIGTKATTASYGAINIHEGASGAPNEITFLDGDGSTAIAGIWKDSSDQVCIGVGDATTSDFTVGASGHVGIKATAPNSLYYMYYAGTPTDEATESSVFCTTVTPTYTGAETASENYNGIQVNHAPIINSGHTNSGRCAAIYMRSLRNYSAADANDAGTLSELLAMNFSFGHFNNHADESPVTTSCFGLRFTPYYRTGTITNFYGIYIAAPTTGGTATNRYPFYSLWDDQSYFQGQIYTAGNCSALTFTDRTPGYEGDGIADIKKIKNKDGKIDHDTLPAFARKTIEGKDKQLEDGRDLGAMISILVKAVQQLSEENDTLKAQMADAIKRIEKLEKA